MSETLTRTETELQQAINALKFTQSLEIPTTRDEFPGFLYEHEITQLLVHIVDKFGKQLQPGEDQNRLLYKSVVGGQLVKPPDAKHTEYSFVTIYPKKEDGSSILGLYVVSGPKNRDGTGINMPIDADGRLLVKEFINSSYGETPEHSARSLNNGIDHLVSTLEDIQEDEIQELETEDLAA